MQILKLVSQAGIPILVVAGVTYAASINNIDKQFLVTVARMDMTEAHEGQVASHRLRAPPSKSTPEC